MSGNPDHPPQLCPICKKPIDDQSPAGAAHPPRYFPFCSERCKLIDLGRWLGGRYQIPVVERDESDALDDPR
jgi:endogenous inhibitor of DNA gyrase (YacG/DUF329 family)